MATFSKRVSLSGEVTHQAKCRRKGYPTLSRTFQSLADAKKSALNNSFLVAPASRRHVGGNAAIEQSSENEDAKKPQRPQDHPEVMASAAQYRVHRVAYARQS